MSHFDLDKLRQKYIESRNFSVIVTFNEHKIKDEIKSVIIMTELMSNNYHKYGDFIGFFDLQG